jgi:imidazoleglycerol-phosphate dehydratase
LRSGEISRKTKETDVYVKVDLDSSDRIEVDTGIHFLDHMLRSLAYHSLISMIVRAEGDLVHHVIEDTALCIGEALRDAVGDVARMRRFGFSLVPMDDSLASAAIDLVRRPYSKIDLKLSREQIEDVPCEDILHFLHTLAMSMEANIHLAIWYGENDHHKVEAAFKALALSLRNAVLVDPHRHGIPSTKGAI